MTDPKEVPVAGETERETEPPPEPDPEVVPDELLPEPEVVPEVVPELVPPLATPVTETCRTVPVPAFAHPMVRLVVKEFSESGVPTTPTEQEPPAAMLEPQLFEEMANTLGLLRETEQPVAATVALELVTV
jgi:protein TonB